MPPKKSNAIVDVVSDLMRAAAGSGAKDIADEDIDKYVADLILKEAEEKRKKYNEIGVQAYQPQPKKPKPNTRFLFNVVKATDSHNQAVIKTNEENLARLRRERELRTKNERRKSHQHHDESRKRHRQRSLSPHSSDDHKRRNRDGEKSSSHHHHHHRSPSTKNRKSSKDEEIQFRGRGKIRINTSSMDKYFSKGYDPLLDTAISDDEGKRTLNKKKKRNEKYKTESSQGSSSPEIGPKPLYRTSNGPT
ncbi:uncharacterized protein BX663DRAFT_493119 [Cokeromyces recurvatus]|uniref:uncharacterized protein n=1 Tax=Cokeromyces recurvatus TaxID=90255 RepID=UPI00221E5A2D|nr:uncharacterized protein BX663DRAFT_493119 [Cokeromyces recurvatus]KAI7908143.1 hypothetical protein BX663DRAFT_493119 [Cokeromyces recurvatus]